MKIDREKYLGLIKFMKYTQKRFAEERLSMTRQGMLDILSRDSISTNTVSKFAEALEAGYPPKDLLT